MTHAALAVVLSAATLLGSPQQDGDSQERARTILRHFLDQDFDAFCAAGDGKMKSGLKPEQARQVWAMLEFQLGGFSEIASSRASKAAGQDVVDFECRFAKGECTLRVVLDGEGAMSGFWMPSVRPADVYKPPAYVDPDAFAEEAVTVDAGGFPLPSTLTLPKGEGRVPAVVLVHGSGPHDQDETIISNKPFRDLAHGLASRGVAVLRYEKRTHKYPEGIKAEDCTLEWETIDDAVAGARLLRGHGRIDPKAVFVAGHSLGAMAAPFIAEKDGGLAGIILLAGNARSILDLLDEQTAYIVNVDGHVSEEERAQLDQVRRITAGVRDGTLHADDAESDGVPSLPVRYLAKLHALRPVEAAKRLRTPMLILQGARDYQVTSEDFDIWKRELQRRPGVEFRLYDDLNHLFMAGKGKSTPVEYQQVGHVDERVVRDIGEWIGRNR